MFYLINIVSFVFIGTVVVEWQINVTATRGVVGYEKGPWTITYSGARWPVHRTIRHFPAGLKGIKWKGIKTCLLRQTYDIHVMALAYWRNFRLATTNFG